MRSSRPPASTWMLSRSGSRSPLLTRIVLRRAAADGDERERLGRLSRLSGPGELRAALLALLARPGSAREQRAWADETLGVQSAAHVQRDVLALPEAARLPWFEVFASRAAHAPVRERSALAEAARRVMRADGRVDARDRLWWLALRKRLGEATPATQGSAGSDNDLTRLDDAQVLAIAAFSAFLSRLVPHGRTDPQQIEPGAAWYRAVMRGFEPRAPSLSLPDVDTTLRALRSVQALPWLLKPVLVRVWCEEASRANDHAPLPMAAADALRLACGLLDSPLPPALARQYIEPG